MSRQIDSLASKFPQYKFEVLRTVPVSLQNILTVHQDVILCYIPKKRSSVSVQSALCVDSVHASTLLSEELSGNPLLPRFATTLNDSILNATVCNTTQDVKDEFLSNCLPLTSQQALSVKNFCNLRCKSNVPVVILCEGEHRIRLDPKQFVQVKRFLHTCWLENNCWKTSGWCDINIVNFKSLPSLKELSNTHIQHFSSLKQSGLITNSTFRCLLELRQLNDLRDPAQTSCNVSLQYEWQAFSVKPPLDIFTKFSLIADIHLDRSPSESLCILWNELKLLNNYINLLENKQEITNSSTLPCSDVLLKMLEVEKSELKGSLLREAVITALYNKAPLTNRELSDGNNTESLALYLWMFTRNDKISSDFTHPLWITLIGCESYGQLCECIRQVFNNYNIVKKAPNYIMGNRENISRLAELSQMGSSELFTFTDKLIDPLECLVELGIEKLLQDTAAIFDVLKIPIKAPKNLYKFTELKKNNIEWLVIAKQWLTYLTRLYASLCLLYSFESSLNNPSLKILQPLMMKVVKQLSTEKDSQIESLASLMRNPVKKFSFDVSFDLLANSTLSETDIYDEWSAEFYTETERKKVTSLFYRALVNPVPYIHELHDPYEEYKMNNTVLDVSCNNDITLDSNTTMNGETAKPSKHHSNARLHCIQSHSISMKV